MTDTGSAIGIVDTETSDYCSTAPPPLMLNLLIIIDRNNAIDVV